jgi:hypothetical protein
LLAFPAALTADWRKQVHALAEARQLGSGSQDVPGARARLRFITVGLSPGRASARASARAEAARACLPGGAAQVTKTGYATPSFWPANPADPAALAAGARASWEGTVEEALAARTVFRGTLSINKKRRNQGYVAVAGREDDFKIEGDRRRNRAFDGDEVAFNLVRCAAPGRAGD